MHSLRSELLESRLLLLLIHGLLSAPWDLLLLLLLWNLLVSTDLWEVILIVDKASTLACEHILEIL